MKQFVFRWYKDYKQIIHNMTNNEIAEFLQDFRVQVQTIMDERMRPVYKNNTWLKQKDLKSNERIIMQLVDEINAPFTIDQLVKLTGLSRKCIRENLYSIVDHGLVTRDKGYMWKAKVIF